MLRCICSFAATAMLYCYASNQHSFCHWLM